MCGIVGILETKGSDALVQTSDLHTMVSAIAHRGPDGAAFTLFEQQKLGLAHSRLSIVDLETGAQPLFNEDASIGLVCNGEIYDRRLWQDKLRSLGHTLQTDSDSEIIVHLYEEYGAACVDMLNGEFAFLLWDAQKKLLLAARDRLGVKPLFYTQVGQRFLFASEIKGLFAHPGVKRQLHASYFAGNLFAAFNPAITAFEHILQVPPGHWLQIDLQGVSHLQAYYQPQFKTQETMSFEAARDGFRQHFKQAVARRLQADVPVQVYLSGGVDSTSIAAQMCALGARPHAYTVSFPGSTMNELEPASRSAQALGLELSTVSCPMERLAPELERTIWATESSVGNLNSVAKLLLSEQVRRDGFKVCLTGEGADELMAGYAFWKVEALLRLERGTATEQTLAQRLWPTFVAREKRNEGLMWSRYAIRAARRASSFYGTPNLTRSHVERTSRVNRLVLSRRMRKAESRSLVAMMSELFPASGFAGWNPVNISRRLALAGLSTYIIPNLGDRVEMANSVECRTPFLDKDLLAFLESVPPEHLLNIEQLREKHLLYESMREILPEHSYQGSKHPFLSPSWSAFAETAAGRRLCRQHLSLSALRRAQVFNPWLAGLIIATWKYSPRSSSIHKSLDIAVGIILSTQMLHHRFVANFPEIPLLASFVERKPALLSLHTQRYP